MSSCSRTRKPKMHLGLCAWVVLMGACSSGTSNSPPKCERGAAGTGGATGSAAWPRPVVPRRVASTRQAESADRRCTRSWWSKCNGGTAASGSGGSTASGSGGSTTGYTLPPALPHPYAPFLSRSRLYEDVRQSLASRRFGTLRCEIAAYGGYGTNRPACAPTEAWPRTRTQQARQLV